MTELKAEDFRFETIPPSPIVPDQDLNRWRYVDLMVATLDEQQTLQNIILQSISGIQRKFSPICRGHARR